jgi:hypothetical protein
MCMLAKLAALLHSKIALAIIGATLVAGTGAVVATATGATSRLPQVLYAQNGAHGEGTHTADDHESTKTPGDNQGHEETHGVVASINAAGSSFTLTVKHEADDDQDGTSDEHGTPTANSTPKPTPTTSTLIVKVNADTKFEGMTKSFGDLKVGMQAEVGGATQTDGSFLATKVEASNGNDGDDDEDDHQQADVSGAVATVGATSFTVKGEQGTMTVTVSSATVFGGGVKGLTDLKVGMHVEVAGMKQTNGSIAAQRVYVASGE